MAYVNVNRKNTDQFYRYKMPKLIAKVEGKGNGIKTVVVNMTDIAKALSRPPSYPTKFFGCELGAQTQIDLKHDRYIVNGSHSADKLQDILDDFIAKFVLCPECDNPETTLHVEPRKEKISQSCAACGYHGMINLVHRLVTFILKNPPVDTSANTPSKGKGGRRKDKKGQRNGNVSPGSKSEEEEHGGDPDIDAPAVGKRQVEDDDWGEDTSEEAVRRRMEDLTSGAKIMTLNDDLQKTPTERLEIFYNYVKGKKGPGIAKMGKEIAAEADRLDVKDKAVGILAELLCDDHLLTQIPLYKNLFLRFVYDNQKAQKYLLGAFEMLVGHSHPAILMPKVPHILKAFYDNDLLEEEVILQWAEKVSKKYVTKDQAQMIHDKAKPFIQWLKEAEEEEDSGEEEEEEEENVEVVYSNKPVAKEAPPPDEDDFDIDAI